MFGFLKKKLKDAVEKISGAAKADIGIGQVEEAEKEIEAKVEAKEEQKEKKELIIESGFEVTQEVKEILEKPEEKKLEEAKEETAIQEPQEVEKTGVKKTKPERALPPGFEVAGEAEKKEETFFKKIRKAIAEKRLEESDIKDILWDLQTGLIENDVAFGAAEKIVSDLKTALLGRSIPKKKIENAVKESLKKSISGLLDAGELNLEEKIKMKKPFLIVFLGFNGVGKTTTIARVGRLLKKKGFICIFAAADTWRAGAIQQIEYHGEMLGIKVIKQEYGSDPAAVIFDAKKYAEAHGIDAILADTAGRSHTNMNLVDELKKICRVNKPDLKILVIDALTGNDVVEQAKYFDDAVGADGIIITKADVYEKGGAILSAAHTIKKPILYLGVGQGYDDLEEFDVEKVADNLLE